ncbi:ABC transporter permease subunit [Shinella sp. M31]|uniref:ABC transporter permease subunit n=1 Tax=Shinella sp. M31 TaxID=3368615 RepID=UPI003BA23CC3
MGLRLSLDGFIQGVVLTLLITVVSMVISLVVAILTALGWLSSNALAFGVATFYASFFRGTPPLVQVLIIYLALPQFGIVLSGLASGILALSLNYWCLSGGNDPRRLSLGSAGRGRRLWRSGSGVASSCSRSSRRRLCALSFRPPAATSSRC